ncbi:MAG: Rne/Rng family ribonuclease [Firmicutes bacterium]|nr:Rne/Rng family ribonuclease [Bacillota bacterium]
MANEILVEVLPEETKVAVLENRELVEIYIERSDQRRMVGNIYRGKVSSVLPGMQAAFVDIGYSKNAFLYVSDAVCNHYYNSRYNGGNGETDEEDEIYTDYRGPNISELLTSGQEITVQVIKGPSGNKGPRITTHITLPGRYLVLLPNADYVGVSRRIENEWERSRLKKIAEKIKPENMGLIIRTVAEGKSEEDFQNDMNFLIRLWETIQQKEAKGCVPRCIHRDHNLLYRAIRDFFTPNIDKFIINDSEQYVNAIEYVGMISPSLKDRVECFDKSKSLFDYYYIDYRLQKALSRKVWLKCGGYIIIDRTEALTVIDVNTGKYVGADNLENTVLKTNLEAANEIAKQLRLRDIGGIIIIDFIDMNNQMHKKMVIDELKNALKKDRTKTTVIGMTELGLIEMTRKKVSCDLSSIFIDECPYCSGTGKKTGLSLACEKIENRQIENRQIDINRIMC